jgi:hypothetical protein
LISASLAIIDGEVVRPQVARSNKSPPFLLAFCAGARRAEQAGRSYGSAKMQSEIYHSENGDRWFLCRDSDALVYIEHKASLSSGGKVTTIELGISLVREGLAPSIRH